MFQIFVGLFVGALLGSGGALELRGTEEGPCLTDYPFNEDVDLDWFDTLPYINGGSKYHLYRLVRVHPQFRQMREFEFYYESCLIKNDSISAPTGSAFGFGQTLANFDLQPVVERDPGILIATPNDGQTGLRTDTLNLRVTLTDHTTFALMVACWEGVYQRGWIVFSRSPELSEETQKLVERHVQALGFRRENVVFLRFDNCGAMNLDNVLNPELTPSPGRSQDVGKGPGVELPEWKRGIKQRTRVSLSSNSGTRSLRTTAGPWVGKWNL